MKNFDGKVAFVTGGASGIGLGMVKNFLKQGMKVMIADYNPDHMAQARRELSGHNALGFTEVDVSDRKALEQARDETLELFGKVHVLCNNAGVSGSSGAGELEFAEWDKALSVNLGGVVNGTKIFTPTIKAQDEGGHIVNTSSMAGIVPLPGNAVYSTAKFAVRGLTESLRMELAPHGIGVSCLYPGGTQSNLIDFDDEAFLDSDDNEFLSRFKACMAVAMTPEKLGEIVVDGIRENRAHILAHEEFLPEIRQINRQLEDSMTQLGEIPEERLEFEKMRREMAQRLLNMPAKD